MYIDDIYDPAVLTACVIERLEYIYADDLVAKYLDNFRSMRDCVLYPTEISVGEGAVLPNVLLRHIGSDVIVGSNGHFWKYVPGDKFPYYMVSREYTDYRSLRCTEMLFTDGTIIRDYSFNIMVKYFSGKQIDFNLYYNNILGDIEYELNNEELRQSPNTEDLIEDMVDDLSYDYFCRIFDNYVDSGVDHVYNPRLQQIAI